MSRTWMAPEAEPYPPPSVTSRHGAMEPAPQAIRRLERDMVAAGWRARIQYAYGAMPHATTGRPLAAKPSWALRMERGGVGAVAVHRGGAWDMLYTWSALQPYRKFPTITEFRTATLEA